MNNNRRSTRNILVRPRPQLRVAGFLAAILLIQSGILFALQWPIQTLLDQFLNYYRADNIELHSFVTSLQSTIFFVSLISLVLALCTLAYGLKISHKIYGPLVPLQRHIKNLSEGNYASRVHLRTGDEFKELEVSLNALAETLEKNKHKTEA